MKKVTIWLASSLMALGLLLFAGICFSINFDFGRLDTVKYVTNTYEFACDVYDINIDTICADVSLRVSEDGKCRVVCYEQEKIQHTVRENAGQLVINAVDNRSWLDHISVFSFRTAKITVYLPKDAYRTLQVKNTTGDISVAGLEFDKLNLSVISGDVRVNRLLCGGDLAIHATTGDVRVSHASCGNLSVTGTTGQTVISEVLVDGYLGITHTTGDIKIENCDARNLKIETTSGDIEATLRTEKTVMAHTVTGDVDVPMYQLESGGTCKISTTTGDITVKIR